MTLEEALAIPAGRVLDQAVHNHALNRIGRPAAYSTKLEIAIQLVHQLPIFVARMSNKTEGYDEKKPYVGGVLDHHPQLGTLYTLSRVRCATPEIALCKAALLFALAPKEAPAVIPVGAPKLGTMTPRPILERAPERSMLPKLPVMPEQPKMPAEGA